MRSLHLLLLICAFGLGAACSSGGSSPAASRGDDAPRASAPGTASLAAPAAERPEVVLLGDSLTAGLGLPTSESYPALLQQRLDDKGLSFGIVNAGVSGDTSAGGLRRLEWALQGRPRVLVVALGANDGLRGLPVRDLRRNLEAIIEGGQRAGAAVILAGIEAPPNNGPEYAAQFRAVYRDLAEEYDVPLIPFLLDGVAGVPTLNQADGIHPNAEGARIVADLVWVALEPVLAQTGSR